VTLSFGANHAAFSLEAIRVVTLRIFDLETGGLAFDLLDLLRVLAPRSLQANWTVSSFEDEFEATGEGAARLEELAESGGSITGDELLALAENTWQVIWGEFVGVLPGGSGKSLITIRAVDSSFYEIITSEEEIVATIKAHFNDVRAVGVGVT
jgi:hypothetical protein